MHTCPTTPFRLERFNLAKDAWEIFYTHHRSVADRFLDESNVELYRSVGYVANPSEDWVDSFAAMHINMSEYK